jgi:predicted nucleic acid-binding protein
VILADTSLWIDFLRGTSSAGADELDERLADHEVLMCGPVATEILTGVDADERLRLWEVFTALAWADLDRSDWFQAGDVRASLRERGIAVSLPDVLIAVAACNRATLWARDQHFASIADVLGPLDLRLLDD